ncbi:hypothetical protein ACY05_03170 [Sterolibacterium denitrificans]|uniref:Uncharacterized protein n=1 Tax=Sterolibacterium denitrificans TaxID=157592 RepID=A0A656ZCW2_9PROT|nr:hypothetical protein ACY05_03170 [Sterolibacterium denitrificans]
MPRRSILAPFPKYKCEHCPIKAIRDIGLVSIGEDQAAAIQLHDHVGVIKTDSHAIGSATEEGASQALRVILKPRSIVRNDDRRPLGKIFFDIDIQLSGRFPLAIRPTYLQPVESVIEQVVQRPKKQTESEISFDIRNAVFQSRAHEFDFVITEPDTVDIPRSLDQVFDAVWALLTFTQQFAEPIKDADQFSRLHLYSFTAPPPFYGVMKDANTLFDFMKNDGQPHAG